MPAIKMTSRHTQLNVKACWRQAILAVTISAASLAHASTATLVTHNEYGNKSVWITIYDLGKTTHLDYGCVSWGGKRDWRSGRYLFGSFYYIRGEVMDSQDCKGKKICDTTIQANPQSGGAFEEMSKKGIRNWQTQYRLVPNGKNCYWEVVDKRSTVY